MAQVRRIVARIHRGHAMVEHRQLFLMLEDSVAGVADVTAGAWATGTLFLAFDPKTNTYYNLSPSLWP